MPADKKTVSTSKGQKEYTCLGCPLTRNRTAWCFRLCAPDEEGHGRCGRIAPHSLRGRTQLSIESYSKKMLEAHFGKLERFYLGSPSNEYFDAGVRISEGEAEIVIPIQKQFYLAAGAVHSSVGYTAMADSALLAVNSIVEKVLVTPVSFDVHLAEPITAGEIIARSRFLGMSGDNYSVESVLTDPEGKELGGGSGAFAQSAIRLSADIGYA